ncbi:rho GTPase-activating protein 27 isoform 2-T2 [Pholidichthys leucotaenia]
MAVTSSLLGQGLRLVLVEHGYEYEGRDGELVSIKPNERYVLIAKTNDHWWHVCCDSGSKASKGFYIPAKYVRELPLDLPSPLDFADPPSSEPVPPIVTPVHVPVPVSVPVPKPLDEPTGTRTKLGDEMTIMLRPDFSSKHQRNDNRMSTFGVPSEFQDLAPPAFPAPQQPTNTASETVTSATSVTTDMVDYKKQPPPSGYPGDENELGKPRVPSFSPADPISKYRSQNQPIPVEVPVVPPQNHLHSTSSSSAENQDGKESPIQPDEEEEEEEVRTEHSGEVEKDKDESVKGEDSHHIYESIQDLNLDLEALVGGRVSPGAPPEAAPAPPPTQEQSSSPPKSPIYANVSSVKKTSLPQGSVPGPAPPSPPPSDPASSTSDSAPSTTDHTPSSSTSSLSGMISPASPISLQDGWQVHTDNDSGKVYYFHPVTKQATWSSPHGPSPPSARDVDQSRGREGGQLASPPTSSAASSQDSTGWVQQLDEASGRTYYYSRSTGASSWTLPEPVSPLASPGSPASRKHDGGPPPLPEEDYPVDQHDDDSVFTAYGSQIPRAKLDLKDHHGSQWKPLENLHLPQRLMGNGVSEVGTALQVKNWRHTIAEDITLHGHRRNISDVSEMASRSRHRDISQGHLLEKAGIINKTRVAENGRKIRKNWSPSWTVLHGGILTFHKDPKSAPTGNASKASQIVPEYTVELRGAFVGWASKDKSSKKNVVELKTRQGCEYLMQYDTESIISDWLKVMQETIAQLDQEHISEDEDDGGSDKEDRDRKRTSNRNLTSADSEQRRVRNKLRRFLQRRPTLQSVKEKGYIRDNVFGCHLDTLCHRESSTVPKFVEKCIKTVERRGLDTDGIYRVSGNLAVIQKLRHKADHEEQLDLDDGQWEEIHVITGALKLFLRELPEPLFPFSCFDKFIAAIQIQDYSLRVSYMKDLVQVLPLPNHDTMELLFKHLRKVVEHKEANRMSVHSLAIVFGPTLLRPQIESPNMTVHMMFQSQIVELMLYEFQNIFSESSQGIEPVPLSLVDDTLL